MGPNDINRKMSMISTFNTRTTNTSARICCRRGEDPITLILSVVEASRRGEKSTSPRRDPTMLRISVVGAF